MKKEEMQKIINQQSATISKLNNTISELNNTIRDINFAKEAEIQNTKYDVEDKFYEQWKQMNGEFIKRFIAEMIKNEDIIFSFDCDYGGYFTMSVNMGKEVLSTYSGEICMERNGLEE